MGVDKRLYYKNELVADLGRSYYYDDDGLDNDDITRLKLQLFASARTPISHDNIEDVVEHFACTLEALIEHYKLKAKTDLINQILEDGALVMRDE